MVKVVRAVILVVETEIVFIGTAPVVIRSVSLLPKAVVVVVESAVVVIWEILASIATVVAGGESVVLTVTAGMLLEETSAPEVVVFVVVFRTSLVICEAGMEIMATVFGAFVVVSKAVGVMLANGVKSDNERVRGVDCVSVFVKELEGVVA